jgi:hypothetical protein
MTKQRRKREEKRYVVIIPYLHRFHVYASSKMQAIQRAHDEAVGSIIGYDDSQAHVEEHNDPQVKS